jgi:hypothetical protein
MHEAERAVQADERRRLMEEIAGDSVKNISGAS